jgi:hypothetical protein
MLIDEIVYGVVGLGAIFQNPRILHVFLQPITLSPLFENAGFVPLLDAEKHLVFLRETPKLRGIVPGKHRVQRACGSHGVGHDIDGLGESSTLPGGFGQFTFRHLLKMPLHGDEAFEFFGSAFRHR